MSLTRTLVAAGLAAVMFAAPAAAAGKGPQIERQDWSFSGIFGTYDQAQLQRGFQVYKEVCSACHGLTRVAFRMLSQPGGPEFDPEVVKALASEYVIQDGPNDEGEMFERAARDSDYFPPIYPNAQAGRLANNGAYPPDLSLITKARGVPHPEGVVSHVLTMGKDILTGYQEGGADYLAALLKSYKEELPEGVEPKEGLYYNAAYPGGWIGMVQPLYEESVAYTDGSPQTVPQYSNDVAAFLMWAADPTLNERKQMGWMALLYLLITAVLVYIAKRRIWNGVPH
ncbi:MAG: cytochrome c1 [Pseudomonadota bacterium]